MLKMKTTTPQITETMQKHLDYLQVLQERFDKRQADLKTTADDLNRKREFLIKKGMKINTSNVSLPDELIRKDDVKIEAEPTLELVSEEYDIVGNTNPENHIRDCTAHYVEVSDDQAELFQILNSYQQL